MGEHGDARIVVYLSGVTESQIDALMNAFATVCVEHGLGYEGEDSPVGALIGLRREPFPDLTDEDAKGFLDAHSAFILPIGGLRGRPWSG